MANLRDIRRRIKSVKNTSQITKAMQMVAATKMRRAQEAAIAMRPYASRLDDMMARIYENLGPNEVGHPLIEKRNKNGKTAVVVLTSEKGLCGPLNTNLLRDVLRADDPNRVYISVGRKGRQVLARLKKNLLADFELKDTVTFAESKTISRFLLEKFDEGCLRRGGDLLQPLRQHALAGADPLPARADRRRCLGRGQGDGRGAPRGALGAHARRAPASARLTYNFEPDANLLLSKLLPYYVHLVVFDKILESRASEHSARMVAMKAATDNAKQLVKDLTLEYNKARQAAITGEILEIASAAATVG